MKKIIRLLTPVLLFCALTEAHGTTYRSATPAQAAQQRRGGTFYTTPTPTFGRQPSASIGTVNFQTTGYKPNGSKSAGHKNYRYAGFRYATEHTSLNYTPISPAKTFNGAGSGNSVPVLSAQGSAGGNRYYGSRRTTRYYAPAFQLLPMKSSRSGRASRSSKFVIGASTGSTRYNAPEVDDQWREQFYAEMGRYPYSDDELQSYISNKQGSGLFGPGNNNEDPGGGTTVPTINDQWREQFYAEFGRYPSSDQELQDYINWKMGSGIFNPTPEEPDPSSDIPTIYQQWMDQFFAEFGRYPNSEKELQDYINWKLGIGVFNPSPTPVGDVPWLMMILLLTITMIFKIKTIRKKTTNTIRL